MTVPLSPSRCHVSTGRASDLVSIRAIVRRRAAALKAEAEVHRFGSHDAVPGPPVRRSISRRRRAIHSLHSPCDSTPGGMAL